MNMIPINITVPKEQWRKLHSENIRTAIEWGLANEIKPERTGKPVSFNRQVHVPAEIIAQLRQRCFDLNCSRNAYVQECLKQYPGIKELFLEVNHDQQ